MAARHDFRGGEHTSMHVHALGRAHTCTLENHKCEFFKLPRLKCISSLIRRVISVETQPRDRARTRDTAARVCSVFCSSVGTKLAPGNCQDEINGNILRVFPLPSDRRFAEVTESLVSRLKNEEKKMKN